MYGWVCSECKIRSGHLINWYRTDLQSIIFLAYLTSQLNLPNVCSILRFTFTALRSGESSNWIADSFWNRESAFDSLHLRHTRQASQLASRERFPLPDTSGRETLPRGNFEGVTRDGSRETNAVDFDRLVRYASLATNQSKQQTAFPQSFPKRISLRSNASPRLNSRPAFVNRDPPSK